MRVAVVSELYPSSEDPVRGVWVHRQAVAARDAGADVHVLVLHHLEARNAREVRRLLASVRRPGHEVRDGIPVTRVPFIAPPRRRAHARWGAWAAPPLRLALARLRGTFPFELVHAHEAVPTADAVLGAGAQVPLVVSVRGGDRPRGAPVAAALDHSALVLADSQAAARRCHAAGARAVRVVHLGADVATAPDVEVDADVPTLVSVGDLVARKRHADVVRALWALRERHRDLRYVVVGDGPERSHLVGLAATLGVADRVELRGRLAPAEAAAVAHEGTVFVLPSIEEAFGVAYVEAMAGGVPAIGCRGEDGPEEIAAAGLGLRLVPPADVEALAGEIDALLSDPTHRRELGARARRTVLDAFSWERCGRETVAAYRDALSGRR